MKEFQKITSDLSVANIVETKEDDYCRQHNQQFTNECHQLPSGRKMWMGCPICQKQNANERHKQEFLDTMKEQGMRLVKDEDGKSKWEKIPAVKDKPEVQPYKPSNRSF